MTDSEYITQLVKSLDLANATIIQYKQQIRNNMSAQHSRSEAGINDYLKEADKGKETMRVPVEVMNALLDRIRFLQQKLAEVE